MTVSKVVEDYDLSHLPEDSDWGRKGIENAVNRLAKDRKFGGPALMDLEDHGFVRQMKATGKAAVYGRIHIPRHDFRVLCGFGEGR